MSFIRSSQVLLFIFCVLALLSCEDGSKSLVTTETAPKFEKQALQQRILGRQEHEAFITRDPATGKVPSERLGEAREYIKRQLNKRSAIPGINWEERGPSNVSGRTRAILIDAGDVTGNTVFAGGVSGGLWKSTDEGLTWNPINEFFDNMAVTALAQDPNDSDVIYFGTGEGVFGSSAVRGDGIWRSTDGGSTFSQIASTNDNPDFHFVSDIIIKDVGGGDSYIFAATSSSVCDRGGIMRSINDGSTWSRFEGNGLDCNNGGANDFASDLILNPANGCLIAAFGMAGNSSDTEADGIYYSCNNGAGWTKFYWSSADEGRIILAAAPTNQFIMYALIEVTNTIPGYDAPRVLKTIDGGYYWFYTPSPLWVDGVPCNVLKTDWCRGQDWYDLAIDVSPINANRLIIGGVDLFLSTDGAGTWTQLTNWFDTCNYEYVHADQHLVMFENSNELWIGCDGGVFKSSNANSISPTFDFRGDSYNVTQFYAADLHPGEGVDEYMGGTQDNGSQHFTQAGINATTKVGGGDGMFSHIDQNEPNIQITATANQIIFGTDDHWATQFVAYAGSNGRFVNPSDYDDSLNVYYAADAPDRYLRWNNPDDGGSPSVDIVTVTDFPGTFPNNPRQDAITSIRVSPSVPDRVYFGFDNGTVYYVDNASIGTSKSATQILNYGAGQAHTVSCIEIDPDDENHMIVTLSNYGVESIVVTTEAHDPGGFWYFHEGNLPDMPVRWAMFDPNNSNRALIATELGVWSTDSLNFSNTDWQPTNTGLANVRCDMLKYRESDKQVLVATFGRGLYTTNDFGICVDDVVINNDTISGFLKAGQSIILNNTLIQGDALLSAPNILINGKFDMAPGSTLETSNVGCLNN